MRLFKPLGFAGALVLSAIVGGTLIGSALAQTDEDTATATQYCDVFLDTLASELGVTRDELASASSSAAGAALDAAVAAGDLTEDRAAEIRDRIDAAAGQGCAWIGPGFARGFGHGAAHGFLGGDVFEAAAHAIGIESSELMTQLRDAGSLQAVVEDNGKSYDDVKAAILDAVRADLDAADVDADRADTVIEHLTTWLDDGGLLDGPRPGPFGPHHRFGPNDTDAEDAGA